MKQLVIDRSKWLRGHTEAIFGEHVDQSYLCDAAGRKCCLGFYLQSEGVKGLRGKYTPEDVAEKIPESARWLLRVPPPEDYDAGFKDSKIAAKLIKLNDETERTEKVREKRIAAIFKKHGVRVKFVGRTPKAKVSSDSESEDR